MKAKQSKFLKKSLFINFLLLSLIMTLLFGSLIAWVLYSDGMSNAYAIIRNKNQAATNYIAGYFAPLHSTIEYLSKKPEIIAAISGPQRYEDKALSLFEVHKNSLENIVFIYAGYKDGTLLINNYTPPDGYDPRKRPWYQAALQSAPNLSTGTIIIEAVTKEWMVSTSKVLKDENGELQGVVSIDTSVDSVAKNLFERDPNYSSSYSYVLDAQNKVIIHHHQDLLGKNFYDGVQTKDTFSKQSGRMDYVFEQDNKIAYYTKIDALGWTVVTVVNKSQIFQTILIRILQGIAFVILTSLLIGQIVSRVLGDKIIAPLKTLEQHVKAIIEGKKEANQEESRAEVSDYKEINAIIGGIEELTQHSLFQKNRELAEKNELLEKLSQTDYLTGLLNRRKFNEEFLAEHQRAKRYNSTFSIILLDIDWFKRINDTYGHDAGDSVLKELSMVTSAQLRTTDRLARWGGEEFLILCPSTNLKGATTIAEKIRSAIEQNNFSISQQVTISAGVSEYKDNMTLDELTIEADRKLYEAKSNGRNQVAA